MRASLYVNKCEMKCFLTRLSSSVVVVGFVVVLCSRPVLVIRHLRLTSICLRPALILTTQPNKTREDSTSLDKDTMRFQDPRRWDPPTMNSLPPTPDASLPQPRRSSRIKKVRPLFHCPSLLIVSGPVTPLLSFPVLDRLPQKPEATIFTRLFR
jgi:hypothetical protein